MFATEARKTRKNFNLLPDLCVPVANYLTHTLKAISQVLSKNIRFFLKIIFIFLRIPEYYVCHGGTKNTEKL